LAGLGLGAITEDFITISGLQDATTYLDGVKTVAGEEFQELLEDLEDLDEAVDEMLGEGKDDLTEEGAARLKEALRALQSAGSPATSQLVRHSHGRSSAAESEPKPEPEETPA
jgi:hypothetical protein